VPRISVETKNGSDIELHYDKALLEFIAAPARQPVGSERP